MTTQPHVLVIDDDTFSAEVLSSMLAAANVNATVITDQRYLTDALQQVTQIDLIFLDLEMPGLNGYELFEEFQADPMLREIPVVACTVHTDQINQAKKLGFYSFLGKPLRQQKFPGQLERLLNGQPVWEVL
jgi:CheY-like chemotaxis protein